MKKIILWSVVGILILGICAAAIWWLNRPQVIQLDKNTKLTLLGVEYGKHHKFPKIKIKTGKLTSGNGPTSFDTTNDTLVVYILQETKGRQPWQALVYDSAQTASVQTWEYHWNQAGANKQIAAVQLDAFPRHDSNFIMRFQSWGNGGQHISKNQFVISNPARGKTFSKWSADAIPDTQSDDDLNVTLTKFNYGVPFNGGSGTSAKGPANEAVLVAFHTEQKGVVVTNWQPIRVETSDATGNHIFAYNWRNERDDSGDATMTYQWGLWPNESPWKLRVEFSKQSNFSDDETWTVTNVPVNVGSQQDLWNYDRRNYGGRNSRTNSAFAETTLNRIQLKLYPVIRFTDVNPGDGERRGGFLIEGDQPMDGLQMTLIKATDEQGHDVQSWNGQSWGGNSRQFQFQNLRNAKSLNITIALHKSRFVEFTVKPTKQ